MSGSVKAQVMQKVEEVLRAVPGLGSVHRWHGRPIDLDRVKLPALFVFEEEETRDKRNRLAVGVIRLHLMTFIPLTPAGQVSFNEVADNLQGLIHNALITTTELKGLVENLVEGPVRREFPNDMFGVLYQDFDLTYLHKWGDAFSVAY